MFTGIVTKIGSLQGLKKDKKITLSLSADLQEYRLKIGDSVAVNGICLTLVEQTGSRYDFNLSLETLRLSNLSDQSLNSRLNIEMPLKLNDYLGGHLVSGHIDGTVRVKTIQKGIDSDIFTFLFSDKQWKNFLIYKGSVTLNGVSLTVSRIAGNNFSVAIIPHTMATTNLKYLKINERVNLELDLVGKYIYNQGLNFRKGS